MAYQISQIKSIELCRTRPFKHVINIKSDNDYVLEAIPVNESEEWAQYQKVIEAWFQHPEYNGE